MELFRYVYGILVFKSLCVLQIQFHQILMGSFFSVQINFFQDHTKLILCPLMNAVTYIDGDREFRTFRLNLIEKYGCSKQLYSRLRYAKTMVERLVSIKSGQPVAKNQH